MASAVATCSSGRGPVAANPDEFVRSMTPGEREYWDAYIQHLAARAAKIIKRVLDEPDGR